MFIGNNRVLLSVLSVFMLGACSAFACSTIVVGKKASATGRVLVGHNEDDHGPLMVIHGIVPVATHAKDELVDCEEKCARVPQVGKTAAFYWSEVRSKKSGVSNADAMLNEHGVFVVSNNAKANADEDAASTLTDGGIRYMLRRAVAERATSARHAVDIASELVRTWGYSLPGRIYTFADKDEAWVFQVVKGRRYVARRCPDDQVVAIANCYNIGQLTKDDVVSPDIAARAANNPTMRFDRAYQGNKWWRHAADTFRWRHMLRIVTGIDPEESYPFSSGVRRPVSPDDIIAALRTHYEGTGDARTELHTDQCEVGCCPVCRGSTIESSICVFGDDIRSTELQVAFGIPCLNEYVKFHPFGEGIPAKVDRSADAARRLARHFRQMED